MPHVKFTSISVEFGQDEQIGQTLDKLLVAAGFTPIQPAPAALLIESSPQHDPPDPALKPRRSPAPKIAAPAPQATAPHKSLADWCRDALRDGPKTKDETERWVQRNGGSPGGGQIYGVLYALLKRGELDRDEESGRYSLA